LERRRERLELLARLPRAWWRAAAMDDGKWAAAAGAFAAAVLLPLSQYLFVPADDDAAPPFALDAGGALPEASPRRSDDPLASPSALAAPRMTAQAMVAMFPADQRPKIAGLERPQEGNTQPIPGYKPREPLKAETL
jgi:hypothetical protein